MKQALLIFRGCAAPPRPLSDPDVAGESERLTQISHCLIRYRRDQDEGPPPRGMKADRRGPGQHTQEAVQQHREIASPLVHRDSRRRFSSSRPEATRSRSWPRGSAVQCLRIPATCRTALPLGYVGSMLRLPSSSTRTPCRGIASSSCGWTTSSRGAGRSGSILAALDRAAVVMRRMLQQRGDDLRDVDKELEGLAALGLRPAEVPADWRRAARGGNSPVKRIPWSLVRIQAGPPILKGAWRAARPVARTFRAWRPPRRCRPRRALPSTDRARS